MMMTMRSLFSLLFLAAAVSAFQPVRPVGVATTTTTTTTSTATFMFNKDKSAKALEEISAAAPLSEMSAPDSVQATSQMSKNVVRDMNTGEIKEVSWYDPAMAANTNPFNLGWANIFVILPAILLLNDFLHFLPSEWGFTK